MIRIALAVAAFALVVPAAGLTQEPRKASDARFADILVRNFADCLLTEQLVLARRSLVEDWDGTTFNAALGRLGRMKCRTPPLLALHTNATSVKRAMASMLVHRELGTVDPAAISVAPPLFYALPTPLKTVDERGRPLSRRAMAEQRDGIRRRIESVAIAQFGECVVRARPAESFNLLQTVPWTQKETATFKFIGPVMPSCLPKGVTMELDKPTLRGAIAIAYYRLGIAAKGSQASKAGGQ